MGRRESLAAAHLVRQPEPLALVQEGTEMNQPPEQLALFALPPLTPTWPRRGTLADRALALLLDGRSLNHPEFEAEAGSWRLAAVVFELRALGWPVQSIDRPAPTPDCPSRCIAIYRLSARDLAALVAVRGGAPA